jgi:hypothetical protein
MLLEKLLILKKCEFPVRAFIFILPLMNLHSKISNDQPDVSYIEKFFSEKMIK